ncbi:hypothetical protein K435DRAFT_283917 [Dendrothele bispora CBS 962.96]|uniref:Uncharacterized protein n=1 Tax=Dendrothele bispora (strain CBS 962.96) TaxID=1314807 RepID=A0A4V4HE46_DENBC|nr:hypothetical protein K435DRAFT_283917 [Dendrothele bispora CBS 962.96]
MVWPHSKRIAGDDSSKVLYKCDNDAQPLIVHYFPNQFDMGVFWVHSTSQSWASQSSSKRDFEPLPFNSGVVSAVNVDCEFGMALSINVTDANGAVTSVNGTDEIRIDVPQALPANVTVAIDNGDSGFAEMLITGKEKVLVSFGGGEEPTISTGYDLQLQVCPD